MISKHYLPPLVICIFLIFFIIHRRALRHPQKDLRDTIRQLKNRLEEKWEGQAGNLLSKTPGTEATPPLSPFPKIQLKAPQHVLSAGNMALEKIITFREKTKPFHFQNHFEKLFAEREHSLESPPKSEPVPIATPGSLLRHANPPLPRLAPPGPAYALPHLEAIVQLMKPAIPLTRIRRCFEFLASIHCDDAPHLAMDYLHHPQLLAREIAVNFLLKNPTSEGTEALHAHFRERDEWIQNGLVSSQDLSFHPSPVEERGHHCLDTLMENNRARIAVLLRKFPHVKEGFKNPEAPEGGELAGFLTLLDNPEVAEVAIRLAGDSPHRELADLLLETAQNHSLPELWPAIAWNLPRLAPSKGIPLRMEWAKNDQPELRLAALAGLALSSPETAEGLFLNRLGDPDPLTREIAAMALAKYPADRVLEPLKCRFQKENQMATQAAILTSLLRLNSPRLERLLLDLFTGSREMATKRSLFRGLLPHLTPDCIPTLLAHLEEWPDSEALALLTQKFLDSPEQGDPWIEKLIAISHKADHALVEQARDITPMAHLLTLENPGRQKIEEIEWTPIDGIQWLAENSPSHQLRAIAVQKSAPLPRERLYSLLGTALKDSAPEVRCAALALVVRLKIHDFGGKLIPLLEETHPEVRYHLFRAFGTLNSPAVETLLANANAEREPELASLAKRLQLKRAS